MAGVKDRTRWRHLDSDTDRSKAACQAQSDTRFAGIPGRSVCLAITACKPWSDPANALWQRANGFHTDSPNIRDCGLPPPLTYGSSTYVLPVLLFLLPALLHSLPGLLPLFEEGKPLGKHIRNKSQSVSIKNNNNKGKKAWLPTTAGSFASYGYFHPPLFHVLAWLCKASQKNEETRKRRKENLGSSNRLWISNLNNSLFFSPGNIVPSSMGL